jgi:predicted nucleic-acid-binding Zn-ribbon protein
LSKMCLWYVQNNFGVVPSVSDGVVQNRTVVRFVLLAGGCPAQSRKTWVLWVLWVLCGLWVALSPANAGREMIVQNGFGAAPSVSDGNIPELPVFTEFSDYAKRVVRDRCPKCRSRTVVRLVMLAAWAKQSLLNDTPKYRSGCPKWPIGPISPIGPIGPIVPDYEPVVWVALSPANAGREMIVQNGFGAAPSVSDGNIPELPVFTEFPDYAKRVVRDRCPKCRSRTVVRLVMLAAWAKQSLLNDTPKMSEWLSKMAHRTQITNPLCGWCVQNEVAICPKCRQESIFMGRRLTPGCLWEPSGRTIFFDWRMADIDFTLF